MRQGHAGNSVFLIIDAITLYAFNGQRSILNALLVLHELYS
jgi:hypothetical protein